MADDIVVPPLEEYSDTVLADVFYESGTILGGRLVALERKAKAVGDLELAARWNAEWLEVAAERRAIKFGDRAGQIACKRKWDARYKELRTVLYPVQVDERVAVTA